MISDFDNSAERSPSAQRTSSVAGSEESRSARTRKRWPSEAFVLKGIFLSMLIASAGFLAYDFGLIYKRANAPLPGSPEQKHPVEMTPPRRDDQVRPYLPHTNPTRRRTAEPPRMPGYSTPLPDDRIAKTMDFKRGPKGTASAVGRIEPGTSEALAKFLDIQNGEIKTLYLHSPGGSVSDALKMSLFLRKHKIETVVPAHAYCASSCPLVVAGGEKRTVSRSAWVGVHQIYAATNLPGDLAEGMSRGQQITANVQDHLLSMGVDLRTWVHAMKTPPHQLYVFTPKELTDYRLATGLTD